MPTATLDTTFAQRLELRPSPALVAYAQLLALPAAELEHVVEQELADNPALERLEQDVCPLCGGYGCGVCARPTARVPAAEPVSDPVARIVDEPDPVRRLLEEARLLLPTADLQVADYVAGSLDRRGYLAAGIPEMAAALGVEPERIVRVVDAFREVGPPGICARDLRECLLLQLDRIEQEGEAQPLARALVLGRLEALANARDAALGAELGVTREEVADARTFIRARLRPFPVFEGGGPPPPLLVADFVVSERLDAPGEFDVELAEPRRLSVAVSDSYERAGRSDERERARLFVARLRQRWRTQRAVAECVVEKQKEFLRRGPASLVPLTRAEVAAALGLHESTVSRATAGKHVLLPSGRVVPFAAFFDAARPAREALVRVVASEPRPLSDGELADELRRRGFRLARRTVAKYRCELGILPSSLR